MGTYAVPLYVSPLNGKNLKTYQSVDLTDIIASENYTSATSEPSASYDGIWYKRTANYDIGGGEWGRCATFKINNLNLANQIKDRVANAKPFCKSASWSQYKFNEGDVIHGVAPILDEADKDAEYSASPDAFFTQTNYTTSTYVKDVPVKIAGTTPSTSEPVYRPRNPEVMGGVYWTLGGWRFGGYMTARGNPNQGSPYRVEEIVSFMDSTGQLARGYKGPDILGHASYNSYENSYSMYKLNRPDDRTDYNTVVGDWEGQSAAYLVNFTLPAGRAFAYTSSYQNNRPINPTVQAEEMIGVMCVECNLDGSVTNIEIVAYTLDVWKGDADLQYNEGADSDLMGGNGTFTSESEQRTNTVAANSKNRDPSKHGDSMNPDGYFGSYNQPAGIVLYTEFDFKGLTSVLTSTDWTVRFENEKYNPDSGIISCNLLPSEFIVSGASSATIGDSLTELRLRRNMQLSGYELPVNFGNPANHPRWDGQAHIVENTCSVVYSKQLDLSSQYYDGYLDFETTIVVHLPFIGEVDVSPALCMGGWLQVSYVIDLLSGSCTAYITTMDKQGRTWNPLVAKGNCAYPLPIASLQGGNYQAVIMQQTPQAIGNIVSRTIGGAMQGAQGGVAGAVAGGLLGGITEGVKSFIDIENAKKLLQSHTQTLGSVTGTNSLYSDWEIWVHITRPLHNKPREYYNQTGHKSDVSGTINSVTGHELEGFSFKGLLKCKTVKLEGISATDEEKIMIEQMMKTGIYV